MKSTSKAMYIVGIIFNVLALISMIVLFAVFNASKGLSDADLANAIKDSGLSVADFRNVVNLLTIVFLVLTIFEGIVFILAIIATVLAGKGTISATVVHIFMIIFSILSVDIFYLLGGIFGLVANKKS